MEYSLVVPLYNEEGNLEELYQRITRTMKDLGSYEIIFIDDGSTDSSSSLLNNLQKTDKKIILIKMNKNTGKSYAMQEGFKIAQGEKVITMDADLQDIPEEIPKLINKLNEGDDMVSGWKKIRHDPLSKTIRSKIFNKVVSLLSGVKIHDFNSGFKIYKLEVVKKLNIYGELHRFIPVLVENLGYKVGETAVFHQKRKSGVSKFGWQSIIKTSFDFLTVFFLIRYGQRPLHFFGGIGSILLFTGLILGSYLTYLRILGERIGERPLLSLTILLLTSGLQFFFTGLLAEMILHLSYEKKSSSNIISNNES